MKTTTSQKSWIKEFQKIPFPKNLVEIPKKDFIVSPNVAKNPFVKISLKRKKNSLFVTSKTLKQLYVAKKKLKANEKLEIYQAHRNPKFLAELWTNNLKKILDKFPNFTEKEAIDFNSQFIASPYHPNYPPHSRGDALDIELWIDGKPANLFEGKFSYDKLKFNYYKNKNLQIHQNRIRLKKIMTSANFIPYKKEPWHFGLTPVWGDKK